MTALLNSTADYADNADNISGSALPARPCAGALACHVRRPRRTLPHDRLPIRGIREIHGWDGIHTSTRRVSREARFTRQICELDDKSAIWATRFPHRAHFSFDS